MNKTNGANCFNKEVTPATNFYDNEQGCANWGACGASCTPNIFKFASKLVKRQLCCKRVGDSIFCDLFLVTIVGQLVKTLPSRNNRCLSTSLTISKGIW